MNTQDKTICVGCRNTYEEINILASGEVRMLSDGVSEFLRRAVRKAGITPQKNERNLEFYDIDAAEVERMNVDGRTVRAAMFEVAYDPVVTINTDDLLAIVEDTSKRYGSKVVRETYKVYEQEMIDRCHEALKLVPEDDYHNNP